MLPAAYQGVLFAWHPLMLSVGFLGFMTEVGAVRMASRRPGEAAHARGELKRRQARRECLRLLNRAALARPLCPCRPPRPQGIMAAVRFRPNEGTTRVAAITNHAVIQGPATACVTLGFYAIYRNKARVSVVAAAAARPLLLLGLLASYCCSWHPPSLLGQRMPRPRAHPDRCLLRLLPAAASSSSSPSPSEPKRQAALRHAARQGGHPDAGAGGGRAAAGRRLLPPAGPHPALPRGLARPHQVAAPPGGLRACCCCCLGLWACAAAAMRCGAEHTASGGLGRAGQGAAAALEGMRTSCASSCPRAHAWQAGAPESNHKQMHRCRRGRTCWAW